ncbi:MAG: CDP-alcohol phosphatidyltransferase family protein [Acidobacteria bacterium]|nr:CDP-alcohol phosphatidyltransferase family protein [Acidobacteriota bacterium]
MTVTGAIGCLFNFPLRVIIRTCVRLRIHPNLLTITGVLVNVVAAWELAYGRFFAAGWWMVAANMFDYIDGKVAHEGGAASEFGGFFDSAMDRFSDISLFIGLIAVYNERGTGHGDYVLLTSIAMMFSVLTSYTRARAESLVEKCKVGFMERPERIVLFMIGAFTNRMAAVLWVILILSIVTVMARVYFTWRELEAGRSLAAVKAGTAPSPIPVTQMGTVQRVMTLPALILWRGLFWTYERASWQYDVMVITILAFVWGTPARLLGDPMAMNGGGLVDWIFRLQ